MICPYISGIDYESVADGPGIRAAIFLSGCNHNCPGCHNPQTHDPFFGQPADDNLIDGIADNLKERDYLTGITLTGGDPLFNPGYTLAFLRALRMRLFTRWNKYSVWLYTGYTWEQVLMRMKKDISLRILVSMCEVVVDGPFVEALADKTLAFRGSSNQRLIDVQKSLKQGVTVLRDAEF